MNELIKNISEDIIYSEKLPVCDNGLCGTYFFHGVDIKLVDEQDGLPLDKYVEDWDKQFKKHNSPAWLYNEDESKNNWNESRYNLVLLLYLSNGGKL